MLLTVLVLASGVALLLHGPDTGRLLLLHKASFIAWLAFMSLHVLGHILEVPREAAADWRREAPAARVAGSSARIALVCGSLVTGVALAVASLSLAGSWLHFHGPS